MIIKGGAAGNVGWWSQHLQRDDTNDRAEVMEIKGLLATDLPGALREMEAIAAASRSRGNFMYQANINPRDNERLTPEQWREAVDTLEKALGMEGHQRVVVEHEKEGRTHRHVMWNRVDVDSLRVTDISNDYRAHQNTARDLEQRFDLTPTPSPTREAKPDRAPELWEIRAAERSGITPEQVKADVTELWRSTDSGKAFAAGLAERGYVLAQGDRRDFVVLDAAGDVHSLARRIEGAKAADVRERMSDIDRESLPTVAEARTEQREKRAAERVDERVEQRHAAQDKAQERWREQREAHLERMEASRPADLSREGLKVAGAAGGAAMGLLDFVSGIMASKPAQTPSQVEKIREQRRALAALERIEDSIARGDHLSPADVSNLTPTHLENIKLRGDAYMLEVIERLERDRERERDYGRTRER